MSWIYPAVTATFMGTILLAVLYWYITYQYRERFLRIWAYSWSIYSIRFVFELLIQAYGDRMYLVTGHQLATLLSGFFLLWGTFAFLGRPVSKWLAAGFLVNAAWVIAALVLKVPWEVLNLPTFVFLGSIYVWTGIIFLTSAEKPGLGKQLTGWGFILWGVHKLNYPFLRLAVWFAPWGYLLAAIFELIVASGTLLVYVEKMRNTLVMSEARFRMFAENAQDLIYRYRFVPYRGFEYVSPSVTNMIGYTPEEYYADPDLVFKIAHPDDRHIFKDIHALVGLNKQPIIMRYFRKDGTLIWSEHKNVPMFTEDGKISGLEGIARDITEQKLAEQALRESERRLREVLENVNLITITLNSKGILEFCNEYLLQLTGWKREEVVGQNFFDVFMPPEKRKEYMEFYFKRLSDINSSKYSHKETDIITKGGNRVRVAWNVTMLRSANGSVIGVTCFGEDITERSQTDEVMKRYKLLCDHAGDMILFFRRDGRIIEANDAAVKMYGYSRKELLNLTIKDLRSPEAKSSLPEQIEQAESRGILFETFHQRKDGTVIPVEVSLTGTILNNERVLFSIVRDITERKKAEETINHLAYHDPLTDLPNRMLFYDRLTLAIAHARRNKKMLAVMFLDLDRFKFVNDMMGHSEGDNVLIQVAKQLKDCVRADDTVGRIGGDEFTILLPEINKEDDAAKVAKKINEAFRRPWMINEKEFQITASIGIALFPNDGQDADTLTRNADTAMYRAKEQGDNYQFYTPSMNVKAIERLEKELDIKRALEQDEFEVFYQPQVNIAKGCIVGMEALLRWNHPEKGLIMPMEIIPVAEDSGLIIGIGEWVLRTACKQNMEWMKAGYPPMRIAVNLSACQFRQNDLVNMVFQVLDETGMEPHFLELEITESTAMQDVEFTIATLKTLRDMGVRIAIDDFGTGYSSLSYLRRFPITTIKVDRSFVRDVLTDVEDAAIVATIIVLAQNLKLGVVVEGVESEAQLAFFEQQECFDMQGYLFSKPEPAAEIEKLLIKASSVQKL